MIEVINKTQIDIDTKNCNKIANLLTNKDIELIILDSDEIKKLNYQFRKIDKTTDVLSFPLEPLPNAPIGSIAVNIDKILENSKSLNHSKEDELALLFLHGLLHLLGYDHENDNGEMRKKEKEIISQLNLPNSLIIRIENA